MLTSDQSNQHLCKCLAVIPVSARAVVRKGVNLAEMLETAEGAETSVVKAAPKACFFARRCSHQVDMQGARHRRSMKPPLHVILKLCRLKRRWPCTPAKAPLLKTFRCGCQRFFASCKPKPQHKAYRHQFARQQVHVFHQAILATPHSPKGNSFAAMSEAPSGHLSLEQFRSRVEAKPVYGARTQLYFESQGARKRSAPTPAVSSQAAPQEVNDAAAASSATGPETTTQGFVVQGPHLEDHTAYQITAGHMGKDVNNPHEVEAFLNSKVATARDVLRLVKNYHEAIIRPELYGAVVQLESAMGKMIDRLFTTQAELRFMASDNRQQQKAESGLKILLTGWPVTMPPQGRAYMIGWMLSQVPEIRQLMVNRALLPPDADHTAYTLQFWYHVLSIEPTTVPQGPNFSTMTMLKKSLGCPFCFPQQIRRQFRDPTLQ